MVKRWRAAALGLCLLSACVGPTLPDRSAPQAYEGRAFSAMLRKDVLSNAVSPEPGVTLYDFHVGSQQILFASVGDKPGYPRFGGAVLAEEDLHLPSGLTAHCREMKVERGRSRECLITLSQRSPKKLHAFYAELEPKWASVADGIMLSIAPRDPKP
jgi:hypothetical protein